MPVRHLRAHTVQPDNVLYLLTSTKWRLLDLGIVANVGAEHGVLHANAVSQVVPSAR
jgi:hypothetical protein